MDKLVETSEYYTKIADYIKIIVRHKEETPPKFSKLEVFIYTQNQTCENV